MGPLFFSKVIPGGNPTIILHEPDIPPGSLAGIAAQLMHPMHLQAEQVGALYLPEAELPFLAMMGGEFCVNATRAAAMLLVGMGRLYPVPGLAGDIKAGEGERKTLSGETGAGSVRAWKGRIRASGMPQPLDLLVCPDAASLRLCLENPGTAGEEALPEESCAAGRGFSAVTSGQAGSAEQSFAWPADLPPSLYCAARVGCASPETTSREIEEGVSLVSMPGMQHLLVDIAVHPLPSMASMEWKDASADWRRRCGLAHAPASGVIWYRKEPGCCRIWPAVEVKASASEHMETACGSASLALALLQHAKSAGTCSTVTEIVQPSGQSLLVFPDPSASAAAELPAFAWIAGPVCLVAQGRVFIQENFE